MFEPQAVAAPQAETKVDTSGDEGIAGAPAAAEPEPTIVNHAGNAPNNDPTTSNQAAAPQGSAAQGTADGDLERVTRLFPGQVEFYSQGDATEPDDGSG